VRVLSKASFDAAVAAFRREMRLFRLDETKIARAEFYRCAIPQVLRPLALGFFVHHSGPLARFLGYAPGHIYIPAFAPEGSVRDVLRHEAGHALAHYYPQRIRRAAGFRRVFGGTYDQSGPASEEFRRSCVSDYAATSPCEDFAETFMFYMKHRGRMPKRFRGIRLVAKWAFIQRLLERITPTR
jgi:hypothetical protein